MQNLHRFFNKANIGSLNDAILLKIFGHLDHEDLASVSQVCKRWDHLVKVCALLSLGKKKQHH